MDPEPDHGAKSYKGSGELAGKRAIITGGDSGIGRAVAIAYARDGADLLISYLNEEEDAQCVAGLIEAEGRKCILMAGDISEPAHCRAIVELAVSDLGGVDILVNNAAHQATFEQIEEISDEEWQYNLRHEHLCNVLSRQKRHKASGGRRHDHQHRLSQCRHAEAAASGLRDDQRRVQD